jgi:hypothetical protein
MWRATDWGRPPLCQEGGQERGRPPHVRVDIRPAVLTYPALVTQEAQEAC